MLGAIRIDFLQNAQRGLDILRVFKKTEGVAVVVLDAVNRELISCREKLRQAHQRCVGLAVTERACPAYRPGN